jgi:hypothetical protein
LFFIDIYYRVLTRCWPIIIDFSPREEKGKGGKYIFGKSEIGFKLSKILFEVICILFVNMSNLG